MSRTETANIDEAGRDAGPPPGERRHGPAAVYLRGIAMGAADIVPGVSGGTMALILGIYERLIAALRGLVRRPFLDRLRQGEFAEAWRQADLTFLAVLVAGIATSVLVLARGLEHLLEHQPVFVDAFFFGLIIGSVWLVGREIGAITPWRLFLFALAAVAAFVFVGLTPARTPDAPWFLFLCGTLAISALLLPGISGAFILVLLGKYQYALEAIGDLRFAALLPLALGAVTGMLTFTQLLGWLFRRYRDATLSVLCGIMLGSLRMLWPWQEVEGNRTINRPPANLLSADEGLLWAALFALLGLTVVLILGRLERTGQ